ncbi:MAG: DUF1015 family protein [Saprospiraceae bacterium]|nr:DUF1015 family protein [Saprospiraceae bacterium]
MARTEINDDLPGFLDAVQTKLDQVEGQAMLEAIGQTCIVLHQIRTSMRTYQGIICLTSMTESKDSSIYPHEATLVAKEKEIESRIERNHAMLKPILLTHEKDDHLANLYNVICQVDQANAVFYDESNETQHSFWNVVDPLAIYRIQRRYAKIREVFLADGHHRRAAMSKLIESDKLHIPANLMTSYFDFNNLEILPYHRIVTNALQTCPNLLSQLSGIADVEKVEKMSKPRRVHQFSLVMQDACYNIEWKPRTVRSVNLQDGFALDTHILNHLVFENMFEISNPRESALVEYVDGRKDLRKFKKKVNKHTHAAGFFLYPIPGRSFVNLSQRGIMLPPKSTWFEPRILKGLVMHKF